jgi:hypothetical protein
MILALDAGGKEERENAIDTDCSEQIVVKQQSG